jgi:competence protein ComEC
MSVEELRGRPLLGLCAGLIVGLTAPTHPWHLLLLLPIFMLYRRVDARLGAAAVMVVGVLIAPTIPKSIMEREFLRGEGRIASVPKLYPEFQTCHLDFEGRRFTLTAPLEPPLSLGDRVRLAAVARPLREGSEPFLLRHSVVGRVRLEGPTTLEVVRPGPLPYRLADRFRRAFVRACGETLPAPVAAMVDAMCFDVDSMLDPETRQLLQRTGTAHIVSASGLHVLIFAGAAGWLMMLLPIPRGGQLGLLGLVLILYAAAAGFNPPVLRAVMMAYVIGTAYLVRREPDLLSALALAAILYLLFKPSGVFDLGFMLSSITVAAFGLFLSRPGDVPRRAAQLVGHRVKSIAGASLVATIATAPLLGYAFGQVSVVSVLANLLVVPVVPVIMTGALGSFLVMPISPSVGVGGMTVLVAPLVGYLTAMLEACGSPEWAAVRVPAFNAYWIPLFYGLMLTIWRPRVVQV